MSTFINLDGLALGGGSGVPATRTLTAGAGLTGGGDLSADRTFDAVANADGSIAVNANDVQVGVLATDAQHGLRGGGTQHAVAVPAGAAGFLSGADKAKLDGVPTPADPADDGKLLVADGGAYALSPTIPYFLGNAAVAPAVNPVGGGNLFETSGALMHLGSSGTLVTLAPA